MGILLLTALQGAAKGKFDDIMLRWVRIFRKIQQRHRDIVVNCQSTSFCHDDVIKWKHLPRNWPFMRGIHRLPVNSPHKSQCRGALMVSLICAWIDGRVNNRVAGDFRRHRAHYGVIVMCCCNMGNISDIQHENKSHQILLIHYIYFSCLIFLK